MKLVDQIKLKEQELVKARKESFRKESENAMKIFKAVELFLRPSLDPKDFIDGERYFSVKREHPEYTYLKEMFTVDVRDLLEENWRAEVNYYTGGSTCDDWELSRLETLGKVAHLIRTKKNELIQTLNGLDLHKNIRKEFYQIGSEIRLLQSQLREKKKVEITNLILSGTKIEFEKPQSIVLGFSDDKRVDSIQVVDQTASGKTVTLEMQARHWDGDPYTFTRKVRTSTFLTSNLIQAVENSLEKEVA